MKDEKMKPKTGLGKGFAALIPQDFDQSLLLTDSDRIHHLSLDKIEPNSSQPRQIFDEEALKQLADSIGRYGVLQPLVVTPHKQGKYLIIAGERRWRASRLSGLKTVPAIVRSAKELEQLEISLVENVQRVDLSPIEQAISIERLHQQFNMTYDSIAQRLGKAPSTINNIVRLLQLPAAARRALDAQQITEGHARAILACKPWPQKQQELLDSIVKNGWSVRQAERFVLSVKQGFSDPKAVKERVATETPQTKKLSQKLGVPVQVRRMAKGGKLEIGFKNDEQLAEIIGRISHF